MATVPKDINTSGYGAAPMQEQPPSQSNLLMAAAEMQRMGKLNESTRPNVVKPHSAKQKLKVIR